MCHCCLHTGHVQRLCLSAVDRSGRCYRCGDLGHSAGKCQAKEPQCPLCADLGRPAKHLLRGQACSAPPAPSKKPSPVRTGTRLSSPVRDVVPESPFPASQLAPTSAPADGKGTLMESTVEEPPEPSKTLEAPKMTSAAVPDSPVLFAPKNVPGEAAAKKTERLGTKFQRARSVLAALLETLQSKKPRPGPRSSKDPNLSGQRRL
ncbi:junctophilin-2-like [Pseudomyrmex gracilis]|uniref:junctophilin-2-like n=1 Tax=Pseudomyrmex gracilis TaxID=219809 RepID=UPI000994A3E2|nr:junctophilin-2-like [Pseudomyrmex gracilis]